MMKSLILNDDPDDVDAFPAMVSYIGGDVDFFVITGDNGDQAWFTRNEAQQLTNWLNDAMVENDGGR